ncbi:CHAT domain-containing protein [Nocardioides alpinus]|uniref:CHAT domain-containing protein n=1 Tax=Nocardioides alpinus TaxID=748909 RepID=A0A1I0X821_9ACTN|nr:CHAT domain-containing protein [Nocardioides alpinus]PKH44173.1 CHAT domain-containing protein [Nocardioides alpinus]SFA96847.1 CHAT domain-containing protein [Nocardioides alpinus]
MDRAEAEELLRTVFSESDLKRKRAEDELVPDADPAVASIGHQIVGIVLRDLGETDAALRELRTALRLARRSGDDERWGDSLATLGGTLCAAGWVPEGMRKLDQSVSVLHGVPLGRALVRRAWVTGHLLAQFEQSATDLREARKLFAGGGDHIWEQRALNLEGLVDVGLGDLEAAAQAFASYGELASALGNDFDAGLAQHNTGWLAYVRGDLPLALELYADADARFDAIGLTSVDLVYDRCLAYLAAGLATDALEVVEQALVARPLLPREEADLLVAVAEAALAAGDWTRATSAADEASRLLRGQSRHVHRLQADLLGLAARTEAGLPAVALLRKAERLVARCREAQVAELPPALLLGARLARAVRSPRAAALNAAWLDEAAGFRRSSSGRVRVLGWLALAQRRALAGDLGGVVRACDTGLRALDEHRATLGSQELRAVASGHGARLAELGTRTALASGHPRQLLRWSERWRATSLTIPSARDQHDPATTADLAALRAQHRRLAEARADGAPTERLQARATRLEQSVRQRMFHLRGTGVTVSTLDVGDLIEALVEDDTVLVELVEVDGEIHALVAGRGRVRRLDVGSAAAATKAVDFALFSLRQAARGRRTQLDVAGTRLQRALLGSALDHVREARVVVSGTSALQGVPWGLMPGLTERPVTSTPSARLWLRARSARPTDDRRVMLVGPGLGSGGAEVPAVAAQDSGIEVLHGAGATVAAALTALDGAALAHVAAHGHFREDSPLFSSLTLADGPLLVHDLQRLQRPPHRVVLSACESGVMAPVGDQELLGLAAALLSMGTAGVVSSLAEVDDAATVEVMVALHASLRAGGGLGDALLAARTMAAGDPVLAATAASFTVLGI